MVDSIDIFFYKDKLFIPTLGITPSGLRRVIEPIYVAELNLASLVQTMQKVIEAGHPRVESVPYSEYRKRDPLLKITKARSWKALAREGLGYAIDWRSDLNEVWIVLPEIDEKGRFAPLTTENMAWRIVRFPIDTPLEELAEFILEDIKKRTRNREEANRS